MILSINERHGSQRKDLPLDIFAVTFGAKSQASAAAALSPETFLSRNGAPATSTSSSRKYTTNDSSNVFQVVSAFLHARARSSSNPRVVFNPSTHLSYMPAINAAAMADTVKRSRLVVAGLSKVVQSFFGSKWLGCCRRLPHPVCRFPFRWRETL